MSAHEEIKQVTPWYSSAEWRHVFKMLYDIESDFEKRLQALNIMKMWKTRTPYLSGGIEGTIEILEAVLNDEQSRKTGEHNAKFIQITYSMAIMRFLNMIVDTTRFNTMFHTAQNMQIPSWIVSLRHEVAHSTKLPSLEVLRKGAQYALHWLFEMYWKLENENMVDYIAGENNLTTEENYYQRYLDRYLDIYENLVLYMTEYRFRRISDINDTKMKHNLLMELNSLLMAPNTFVNEHCYLKSLLFVVLKKLNEVVKRFKDKQKCYEIYANALMNCKLFLSPNILQDINPCSKQYVKFWMPVLDHIHVTGALAYLIKRLMDLSCESKPDETRDIACAWIEYILKSIAKCKAVQKITETKYATPPTTKRAIIEVSASSPDLQSPIMFRPDIPIDEFFTNLDAIKYALLNHAGVPNGKYWKILLLLTDVELPADDIVTLDNLQNLVNNLAKDSDVENGTSKKSEKKNDIQIYTAQDLESVLEDETMMENHKLIDTDSIQIVTVNGSYEGHNNIENADIWKEAQGDLDWKSCAIGVLPRPLHNYIEY